MESSHNNAIRPHYNYHDALFFVFRELSQIDLRVVSFVCKKWREVASTWQKSSKLVTLLNDPPKIIDNLPCRDVGDFAFNITADSIYLRYEYNELHDCALFYDRQHMEYLDLATLKREPSSLFPDKDDSFTFILAREKHLVAVSPKKICIYDENENAIFQDEFTNPDLSLDFSDFLCEYSKDWVAVSYPKTGSGMTELKDRISLYHLASPLKRCEITFEAAEVCAMALSSKYLAILEVIGEDQELQLHVYGFKNGGWKLNKSLAQKFQYDSEPTLRFISEEHILFIGDDNDYLINVTSKSSVFLKGEFLSSFGDWMACYPDYSVSNIIEFYQISTFKKESSPSRTLVTADKWIHKAEFLSEHHFLIATQNFIEVWGLETKTLLKKIDAPYKETGINDSVIFKNELEKGAYLVINARKKLFHWGLTRQPKDKS